MQGSRHTQCVKPELGLDPVVPRQDSPVEHGVVAEDRLVAVVNGVEEPSHVLTGIPVNLFVVDLDGHADHLEPLVAYVFFCRHLGQRVLTVVVGLEVYGHDVHDAVFLIASSVLRTCQSLHLDELLATQIMGWPSICRK